MQKTIYKIEVATAGWHPQARAAFIHLNYPKSVIDDLKTYAKEYSNLFGDDLLIAVSHWL